MTNKAIIKGYCKRELCPTAKVIINRQQAEIEKLQKQLEYCEDEGEYWESKYKNAKIEAIKEFADRLKKQSILNCGCVPWYDIQGTIDNLVAEMVGEDK